MSPFDAFEQAAIAGIGALVGVVLVVFFLRKLLGWMDERGWILYSGDPLTYGTLGRAFLELQGIAQPEKVYARQVKNESESKVEADDEGGPDDPTRHLRHRRGKRRRSRRRKKR